MRFYLFCLWSLALLACREPPGTLSSDSALQIPPDSAASPERAADLALPADHGPLDQAAEGTAIDRAVADMDASPAPDIPAAADIQAPPDKATAQDGPALTDKSPAQDKYGATGDTGPHSDAAIPSPAGSYSGYFAGSISVNCGFTGNVCYVGGDLNLVLSPAGKSGSFKISGSVTNGGVGCMKGGGGSSWTSSVSGTAVQGGAASLSMSSPPISPFAMGAMLMYTSASGWSFVQGQWYGGPSYSGCTGYGSGKWDAK